MRRFHVLLFFVVTFFTTQLQAQDISINHSFWQPNEQVNAIAEDTINNVIYIGGDFTEVRQSAPFGASINLENGELRANMPVPNGEVRCAIQDDFGGWFIGGQFTRLNDEVRVGLAYITPEGTLGEWNLQLDSFVTTIEIFQGKLVIGGPFTLVDGNPRDHIAAFDLETTELIDWHIRLTTSNGDIAQPKKIKGNSDKLFVLGNFDRVNNQGDFGVVIPLNNSDFNYFADTPNDEVTLTESDGNGGWIIAGNFTQVGDSIRNKIAQIDASGKVTGLNIQLYSSIYLNINSVKIAENILYIGGRFEKINNIYRDNVAAIDLQTGVVLPWNPRLDDMVNSFDIVDSTLFITGFFEQIGNWGRYGYSTNTQDLDQVLMECFPSNDVKVAIPDGNGGWVISGSFEEICDSIRDGIAHINQHGYVQDFNPTYSGVINDMALVGDSLIIAGEFYQVNGQQRKNIAILNLLSSELYDWNPESDLLINDIEIKNGQDIYFGGEFKSIGGHKRLRVAGFNLSTGNILDWKPKFKQPVDAIKIIGDDAYIAGHFSLAGAYIENGAPVSIETGEPQEGFPDTAGDINVVVGDNQGGWFIGGAFTKVGLEERWNVAHIDADGEVTNFAPVVYGEVTCLWLEDNRLYIAGDINQIDGQTRRSIAAYDIDSNSLTNWTSSVNFDEVKSILVNDTTIFVSGINGTINNPPGPLGNFVALSTQSGAYNPNWLPSMYAPLDMLKHENKLYVAGGFSAINGMTRNNLACFDLNTGNLLPWDPEIFGYVWPYGRVNAIEKIDNILYVAGGFTQTSAGVQPNLVAFDMGTGEVLSDWNINLGVDETIFKLHAFNGDLYFNGEFESIGAIPRPGIAAISGASGDLLDWIPNITGFAQCMQGAGDQIFLGGTFIQLGGKTKSSLARASLSTGEVDDWAPIITSGQFPGKVKAIEITGNHIFIGGDFDKINDVNHLNLARLSTNSNLSTLPNLNANNDVLSLAVNGSRIYVGGIFTSLSGDLRNNLASLEIEDGNLTDWNPIQVGYYGVNTIVSQGSAIYIGGEFEAIGGLSFDSYGAIKRSNGLSELWPFSTSGSLAQIKKVGDNLFISGNFSEINDIARNKVAIVSPITAEPTAFNPEINFTSNWPYIMDIAVAENNLYIAGSFDGISGLPRNGLASLQLDSGELNNWNPQVDGSIKGLESYNSSVFIAGNISHINGVERENIGLVDGNSGELNDWHILVDDASINCLAATDSALYMGGTFEDAGGARRRNVAQFDASLLELTDWKLNIQGGSGVSDFAIYDSVFYAATNSLIIDGIDKKLVAAFNLNTAELLDLNVDGTGNPQRIEVSNVGIFLSGTISFPGNYNAKLVSLDFSGEPRLWEPDLPSTIYDFKITGNSVLFCGGNLLDLPAYKYLAKIDAESGEEILEWNPGPNFKVSSISVGDSEIYIGGSFSHLNPVEKIGLAAFDASTGNLLDVTPSVYGKINDLVVYNGKLYIGGDLETIDNEPRSGLAAIAVSDGSLTDLNLYTPNYFAVNDLLFYGDTLFIGGFFNQIGGLNWGGNKLAALDLNTDELLDWWDYEFVIETSAIQFGIRSMDIHEDILYLGGNFSSINDISRIGAASIDLTSNTLTDWSLEYDWSYNSTYSMYVAQNSLYMGGMYQHQGESISSELMFNLENDIELEALPNLYGIPRVFTGGGNNIFVGIYGSNPDSSLLSIDKYTNELKNWNPKVSGDVYSLHHSGERLYIGGDFNDVGDFRISNFAVLNMNLCDSIATCNDITLVLNVDGTQSFNTNQVDVDISNGNLCNWEAISLSQTDFSCENIGENLMSATLIGGLTGEAICSFTINIISDLGEDLDADGLGDACDLCFGINASGDSDGDGVCDDSEIVGCQDVNACDYNPNATDPGTCLIFPEPNCTTCDQTAGSTELILIDTDNDGVCNADEIVGCMIPTAPNYNPLATDPGICEMGGLVYAPYNYSDLDLGFGRGEGGEESGNTSTQWGFLVYPNPWQGTGDLRLNFHAIPKDGEYKIVLFDITGRILIEKELALLKGNTEISIQIEKKLGSGTFFISATDNFGARNFQILVFQL